MTATLEIGRPAEGVFVLNSSHLDGADLLADGPTAALEWESIGEAAVNINARRGGRRDGIATQIDVGTLNATLIDGIDPIANPSRYRPGVPIRLSRVAAIEPDFTGIVRKINSRFNKRNKSTITTIAATDSVQALANTKRYGAIAPGGSEPWPDRFARLLQSSPVPYVLPTAIDPDTAAISHTGAEETGLWSGSWTVVSTALFYDSVDGGPVTRTFSGLTPGSAYSLRTVWAESPYGITVTIDADILDEGIELLEDGTAYDITFIATESSHILTASTGFGYYLHLFALELVQKSYVPWAPSIDIETNLATHLDIAATSASVLWMADRNGITRVVTPGSTPVLHFTDNPDPDVATDFSYTDVAVAYDTDAVINTITVTNDTMAGDPEAGIQTKTTFTDVTSAATYGSASKDVETAIAMDGRNGYVDGVTRFAEALLTRYAEPTITISEVVINVTDHPELVDLLEVYALVSCTWRTVTRDLLILAIEHNHQPTIHQITLTLGATP